MEYTRNAEQLHPAMLVGFLIDHSSDDVVNGNDPTFYSGAEGKIPDLNGKVYSLKTKVY